MNRIIIITIAVLIATSATAADKPVKTLHGVVYWCIDGDSVRVELADKSRIEVRLRGADAPEYKQPAGNESLHYCIDNLKGKSVELVSYGLDKYGRTLGWIKLPGKKVYNLELVRAGWAWWYRQYLPKSKEFEEAELEARAAKRGVWSVPNAIPPWEWRRGRRK